MRQIMATIEVECELTVIDLPALIRDNLDWYREVDCDGYQPWERPSVFLHELLAQDTSFLTPIGKGIASGFEDDPRIEFRWSEQDYRDLIAECPEADLEVCPPPDPDDDRRPGPGQLALIGGLS